MNPSQVDLFSELLAEVLADAPESAPIAGVNPEALMATPDQYQQVFAFLMQKLITAYHIRVTGCYCEFQTCMEDIFRHRFENGLKEYCIPVGYFPTKASGNWWLVKYNIAIRPVYALKVYIQVGDDVEVDVATREVEIGWNHLGLLPRIARQMIKGLDQAGRVPEYDEEDGRESMATIFERGVTEYAQMGENVTRAINSGRYMPRRSYADIEVLTELLISKKDKIEQ